MSVYGRTIILKDALNKETKEIAVQGMSPFHLARLYTRVDGFLFLKEILYVKKRFPNPAFSEGMNVFMNKNGLVSCMTIILLPM